MENPLKQGLKPTATVCGSANCLVSMENPLKQGLKHATGPANVMVWLGFNGESIKTRIEAWGLLPKPPSYY